MSVFEIYVDWKALESQTNIISLENVDPEVIWYWHDFEQVEMDEDSEEDC